ncbi:exodeoxyribonuclease VII large subunit [Clostridium sp. 'deep sea']|uniref:exodeoxyribonuclease VII large subunit n=1 Tax=Clostridium sp. 'deep sea' TaxID=2779445 RepID=UPI0018967D9E|nr:exodeoxyribonuclease VII large subunit [Clostridium sp. 'deep sea']QOR35848.1 exodeoxyribonuclease VII large subunit [Clostridium sp. 'deep sea']
MQRRNRVYTVTEVNKLLKQFIEEQNIFNFMLISGEIVNFKRHTSGHLYFSLKDNSDRVKCVMFNRQSRMLTFRPKDGMQVLVQGRLSVYPKSGEYQIYVDSLHPMGVGDLHFRFLELKEKLETLGYFNKEFKRNIVKIPKKIGVVTSATGAAVHDIIRTIKNKYPPVQIILAPAKVQGMDSAAEIVKAIKLLNEVTDIDTIIVGRGGGATEELWSFNEECVIKAIRESAIPVVSAVGHEIDTTLADLAADKTAATPTAAGELVVPDIFELQRDCDYLLDKLVNSYMHSLNKKRSNLSLISKKLLLAQPTNKITQKKEKIKFLYKNLQLQFALKYNQKVTKLEYLKKRLYELKPQLKLAKGYTLVYNIKGEVIKSVADVKQDENIKVVFNDGSIKAQVLDKEVNKNEQNR